MFTRRILGVVGLVWCSWICAASYQFVSEFFAWRPEAIGPEIPYLLLAQGTKTNVVSSVSYFVWILGVGVACCIPTEAGKLIARASPRPVSAYIILLVFQGLLISDVLRTYAYDWWRYLLSLISVMRIDHLTWMQTSVARVPWPSGLAAVCLTLLLYALAALPTRRGTASEAEVR
jgi:hypothetical protein